MNGRNFEYFGEDPFLGAGIAVGYVEGVQSQRVSATIKHFVGNNSEFARRTSDSGIDERALRELYLPIFEAAVKQAHVGAVMCSYNLTNGLHMSENPDLDSGVLKREWGFSGILMSDWDATHDGVASVKAGLDLEMPTAKFMNRETLLPALKDGRISRAMIDDKLRRLLGVAERFGWLDGVDADLTISRYSQTGREVARRGALEGMVLLKNDQHLLPLDPNRIKNIAVIGPLAYPGAATGGGSARVQSFNLVNFLRGISEAVGSHAVVTFADGVPPLQALGINTPFMTAASKGKPGLVVEEFADPSLSGSPLATRTEFSLSKGNQGFGGGDPNFFLVLDQLAPERRQAFFESLGGGSQPKRYERWTGYFTPKKAGNHTLFVQDRAPFRLLVDDQVVIDSSKLPRATVQQTRLSLPVRPHRIVFEQRGDPEFGRGFFRVGVVREDGFVETRAKQLAAKADAVIVPVGFDADQETEASDRSFELPPGQSELIRELAAVNPNLVVVVTSGGSVSTASWLGQARALIAAWFPGQEGGAALGQLLLGETAPSGRLPISWERRPEDNPSSGNYYYNDPSHPQRVVYKEGIFAGYRGYAHAKKKPLFPFGYGLSYTTFAYSQPVVSAAPESAPHLPSGRKPLYFVSFDITNTGTRAGAEVAQVYISPPASSVPRPVRELKGFQRVELAPQQTAHVVLPLDVRSFSYYDV
ncbi:MAG TPA: glycoside hydrolase family 3 C-terminal domain-containing protein, partial [Polyangiaceae bacterium]|nr:glycoside hydrolase family 3 C-terminal domain-containing protein [Polyangiaceae bacterium]